MIEPNMMDGDGDPCLTQVKDDQVQTYANAGWEPLPASAINPAKEPKEAKGQKEQKAKKEFTAPAQVTAQAGELEETDQP